MICIGTAAAKYRAEFNRVIDADPEVKTVILMADIDAGRMEVDVHDGGPMVEISVVYNSRKFEVEAEYESAGGVGDVFLRDRKSVV